MVVNENMQALGLILFHLSCAISVIFHHTETTTDCLKTFQNFFGFNFTDERSNIYNLYYMYQYCDSGSWSPWTNCSVTCGIGVQQRQKIVCFYSRMYVSGLSMTSCLPSPETLDTDQKCNSPCASDKTRLTFENCPSADIEHNGTNGGATVFWPPIHLKYNSSNVTVFQSNSNGQFFTYGTHVIQYIAIDNIGHSNQCRFAVTVKQRQKAVEKRFYSPFNTLTVIGITVSGIFLVLFVILITMVIKWRQSGKKKISNNKKINSQQTPTHTFKEILPDAYDEIKENQMLEVYNTNKAKLTHSDGGYEMLPDSKKIENPYTDITCG